MFYAVSAVVLGFLLDLALGDPHWLPHPVRLIGWLIARLEQLIRPVLPKTPRGELLGGILLTLIVVGLSGGVSWCMLHFAAVYLGKLPAYLLEVVMCYQLIAVRSLKAESMRVYRELQKGDLASARIAVSMIVGRDTEKLSPAGVAKAAVETVAENTSDGVAAPLFYLLIGGAPLGFCYKAINTLDSMIGYRNEQYLSFGKFAAKLDDAVNFIPARLCALLMIAAAFFTGLDGPGAFRIWKCDRKNHKSPNSAQTEAACAGALGVQLAGNAFYGGVLFEKPTIGDARRMVIPNDIRLANRLMVVTSLLSLAAFSLMKLLIIFLLH
ncbi:adenosylcobinamide-phosphate synthase CbiB [Marasmitruncus massiliensis]|uniref:adenosylcobinamide-phosphate synthase CbiB n=1 Tax=Marasmitruncus massiliensis TaxID=1944642 RepID=UPI000C7C1C77|nr:adenosylcobinamide-phosphate synthase CbiB [Marasmitruncus massiliensis]